VSAQLATLSEQVARLEASLAQLAATGSAIQGVADETNALVTQIGAETQRLLEQPPLTGEDAASQLAALDMKTLLGRLDTLQQAVESAQGSSAAVGLSQSAYTAASEAVTILRQLQSEIRTQGAGAPNAPILLNQLNDKLTDVSQSVTVIPGQVSGGELGQQLKQLAEQAKGIASEKGYRFDALYEISASQSGDVKTMRNQVEEMKALLEVQRAILERNVNQPIIKTWFEGG
jgi:hypothetical protein